MLICSRHTERFPGVEYREVASLFGLVQSTNKWYFWQSSFDGAFDYHYIVQYDKFQKLNKYDFRCGSSLKKYYRSADQAIKDLESV